MKIEIDISEVLKSPLFVTAIAEQVCDRMFDDLIKNEWRNAFIKELEKELVVKVKDTVDNWLSSEDDRIKNIIKQRFQSLSGAEIVELIKSNKLPI